VLVDIRDRPAATGPDATARAILGVVLVLVAVLHGIGANCWTSADQLAGWPWRG
jgi:hypothetical protein